MSTAIDLKAIGQRLAIVRSKTGMTQLDFAEALGLSRRAYINYEQGRRDVPVSIIKTLMDDFNTDPVWLIDGGDTPFRKASQGSLDYALLQHIDIQLRERLAESDLVIPISDLSKRVWLCYEQVVDKGANVEDTIDFLIKAAA